VTGQVLAFAPLRALYPIHAPGFCGGSITPLAKGETPHGTDFCDRCGIFLGEPIHHARALRAQRAAGLEPERLTEYLSHLLRERRTAWYAEHRERERAAGVAPPKEHRCA
jgi:hypothetical protein